ncbi:MAG: sigma-70 family RNA polymerase sigma factor [Clostridiales bacterium]|nr:sigma-70 family RNA polymerase sigma factor [Clostridiales bacterium]
MNSSENQLEYRALKEFVRLVDDETSLGMRVRCVICEELTVRQRELINMYYMENMTMPEIAGKLGITVSSVSRTIARGRLRIRKYLKYNGRSMMNSCFD